MDDDIAIKVDRVSKKYCKSLKRSMLYGVTDIGRNTLGLSSHSEKLRKSEFWAVNNVSLDVEKGESLGIIGPNGSGKTTLLKMLNGIFWPDNGKITIRGRVGALIEVGAGFHPLLTGRENVYINAAILGMTKKEVDEKFDAIIEFADIGDFVDVPVKFYSSGMFVRLGFAVAVHCEPDILLVDEVLAVGDARFQTKSFEKMSDLLKNKNCTVVLISHHMAHIARICDKALFLNHGETVEYDSSSKVIQSYRSYTSSEKDTGSEYYKPSGDDLGKVNITGVSIKNGQGVETNKFCSGDNCHIEVSYFTLEQIKNPVVTISFTSVFDGLMTHYSTKGDLNLFFLNGEGIIALDIFYLGLSSGKWKMSVGIFDQDDIKPIAWKWFIAEIDVHERQSNIMLGRFCMPYKWEVINK